MWLQCMEQNTIRAILRGIFFEVRISNNELLYVYQSCLQPLSA